MDEGHGSCVLRRNELQDILDESFQHFLGSGGALWQKDYFDRIIRDWKHFANVARYIQRNPAKSWLSEGGFTLSEDEIVKRILG